MIIVSHYERFLELLKPEFTHVLVNGKIVLEGGADIFTRIDNEGYDWIYKEYGIDPEKEEEVRKVTSIGTCAVREAVKESDK